MSEVSQKSSASYFTFLCPSGFVVSGKSSQVNKGMYYACHGSQERL